ncbi:hypothetical protein RM697_10915 [Ichthyenterobacterium sp. W332]|uniref:Uncharacterized protein n=1 Tax=Microcosmobacter mediterraneus TaxID=3075607 RepID=A0ABU2YLY3_9FLAO|nr:hypothetical protein [Ichthyenterobacterium sp. W332]MDT0559164.1 hypothetical protein [Ichthyenterobacterium sp. W332]
MLKAALSNGLIWTGIMFIIFYVAKKPITLEIFALIFFVFTALGAIKFYFKNKKLKE